MDGDGRRARTYDGKSVGDVANGREKGVGDLAYDWEAFRCVVYCVQNTRIRVSIKWMSEVDVNAYPPRRPPPPPPFLLPPPPPRSPAILSLWVVREL